jgi:type II secretory pathway component PulF
MSFKLQQLEELFRHLASRVEQGRPLHSAFAELAALGAGAQRQQMEQMAGMLECGESLETVLKTNDCSWPQQYKQMLVYGAENDGLAVMLRMAADIAAYEQESKARRSLALAYPVMGIAVAILVFFFMAGGGVAASSQIFGGTFPFPGRYRWLLSILGVSWGVWVVAGLVMTALFVGGGCFLFSKRKNRTNSPVSGRSRNWLDLALASRVISRMARQNMPLPVCLRAAAQVVRTAAIAESLLRGAARVEQGGAANDDSEVLDTLLLEALDQDGGDLSDNLFSLAELYTVRMHEAVTQQVVRAGVVAMAVFVAAVFVVIDFFAAFYAEFLNGIGTL